MKRKDLFYAEKAILLYREDNPGSCSQEGGAAEF